MRIERWWCGGGALVLLAQIFTLGALPFELREPLDKVFHFVAYASLLVMLWIAADGRRPLVILAAVLALGAADELRQGFIPARSADFSDFLADAAGAAAAAALLYWRQGARKPCVESSPRSRGGTSFRS